MRRSRSGCCDLLRAPRRERDAARLSGLRTGRTLCLARGRSSAAEIGIKTYHQRGEGTDFKQLAEYRIGDAVRHIDWKATLRFEKPIVREFQNERDQCVMLLVDCGRRMRADDRQADRHRALRPGPERGDAAHLRRPEAGRCCRCHDLRYAGRRRALVRAAQGRATLNALMGELFAVQPTPTHSDYRGGSGLLRSRRKRALVIVITNFRDEDASELGQALKLLRSRHLVLTASLRERIVGELIVQPLGGHRRARRRECPPLRTGPPRRVSTASPLATP